MELTGNRKRDTVLSDERTRLVEEIRRAEEEWRLAQWRFQEALGEDHIDYAIYCLEAAEKKLDILLRKAKWQWDLSRAVPTDEGRRLG